MIQVVPAIIPYSKKQLEEEIGLVCDFAKVVQVDISDGIFTPVTTWPYGGQDANFFEELKTEKVGWPKWEEVSIELHLMIQNPEVVLEDWIKTGISSAVVHIETVSDMEKIIEICKSSDVGVGISIKPSTDIKLLAPYIKKIDFIQCMGSDSLGRHGVSLDDKAKDMIRELHYLYPECIIGIDIGVTEETASELVTLGASKLVSGSAILNADDPQEAFNRLQSTNGY